jgi:hypothetical protein
MFQSGVKRFGFWDSTFLIDWASTQDESLEKIIELDFEELFYEETIHAFLNIVQKMRLPSLKNLFSLTIQPVLLPGVILGACTRSLLEYTPSAPGSPTVNVRGLIPRKGGFPYAQV